MGLSIPYFTIDDVKQFVYEYVSNKYGVKYGEEVNDWPTSALIIFFMEHYKGRCGIQVTK